MPNDSADDGSAENSPGGERFDAPPELIKDATGRYGVMYPQPDQRGVGFWMGDQWKCNHCGCLVAHNRDPGPGKLEEPQTCHSCDRKPNFSPAIPEEAGIDDQTIYDLFPGNYVYDPPANEFDFDGTPTFAGVYEDIKSYLRTYWAAGDSGEWVYDMLTCYAMSTWFRECWNFVPHLLVQGRHNSGKSRLLNTLKNVSYRCVHNSDLTSAYLYRGIDTHNLTMYISEYHRLADEEQQSVDSVVNAGQKRGETIGRASEQAGGGYGIESFDPFTHVAINTQYQPDDDLVSRCYQITTKPTERDLPRKLRDKPMIRSKMLYLRFRYLRSGRVESAEQQAVSTMDELGVRNRLSEKLWCILTMGELAGVDLSHVVDAAIEQEEDRQSNTEESIFTQAVLDEAFDALADTDDTLGENWEDMYLSLSAIRSRFDRISDREVSNSYIGQIRGRLGIESVRHSDGTKLHDPDLKGKLEQLASDNNVDWSPSPGIVDDPETVELRVEERPKHSLEEENDAPTQEERKDHVVTVCRMLHDPDAPTEAEAAAEMAAEQFEGDQTTYRNELELMIGQDYRFESLDNGERFNFLE